MVGVTMHLLSGGTTETTYRVACTDPWFIFAADHEDVDSVNCVGCKGTPLYIRFIREFEEQRLTTRGKVKRRLGRKN